MFRNEVEYGKKIILTLLLNWEEVLNGVGENVTVMRCDMVTAINKLDRFMLGRVKLIQDYGASGVMVISTGHARTVTIEEPTSLTEVETMQAVDALYKLLEGGY